MFFRYVENVRLFLLVKVAILLKLSLEVIQYSLVTTPIPSGKWWEVLAYPLRNICIFKSCQTHTLRHLLKRYQRVVNELCNIFNRGCHINMSGGNQNRDPPSTFTHLNLMRQSLWRWLLIKAKIQLFLSFPMAWRLSSSPSLWRQSHLWTENIFQSAICIFSWCKEEIQQFAEKNIGS